MSVWRPVSLPITAVLAAACVWLDRGVAFDQLLTASDIHPDQGFAYSATITATPFGFVLLADDLSHPDRALTVVRENGRVLGDAHSLHDKIRRFGRGAFSQWGNALYFSASDNSDPRTNGRSYVACITVAPTSTANWLLWFFFLGALPLNLDLLKSFARGFGSQLTRVPGVFWAWRNVVPGLVITLTMLGLVAAGGEAWLHLTVKEPFIEIKWPSAWSPEASFTFAPHAEIQYTNHLDYWIKQKTNAYGFADRDWSPAKLPGVLRIEFIGDSFVEAVQVPIEQKSHVLFEEKANQVFGSPKIETAAFGMSGTGQANQLKFYDSSGCKFHPAVVILVVVSNDFGNEFGPVGRGAQWLASRPPPPVILRSQKPERTVQACAARRAMEQLSVARRQRKIARADEKWEHSMIGSQINLRFIPGFSRHLGFTFPSWLPRLLRIPAKRTFTRRASQQFGRSPAMNIPLISGIFPTTGISTACLRHNVSLPHLPRRLRPRGSLWMNSN